MLALASLAALALLGALAATGHTADSRDGRDWHPHTPTDTGRDRNDDDGGGGGARTHGNEGVARVLHYRTTTAPATSTRHPAEESRRRAA